MMKKLLSIIVLGLLLGGNAYAEIKLLETDLISQGTNNTMIVSTICIDGYKFISVYDQVYNKLDRAGVSTSITQSFVRVDGKSVPALC